jgi:hypothetical protein
MSVLDEIGMKYGTDKASSLHDYLRHYERMFGHLCHAQIVLLELGVGPTENMGASLFTWAEFFPHAQIVGADIRSDAATITGERIDVEIGDCGNPNFLINLGTKYQPNVVIDDASHRWSHQIMSFEYLFPALKPGGFFVLEDLETSFSPWRDRNAHRDHYEDAAEYFSRLAKLVMGANKGHASYVSGGLPGATQARLAQDVDFMQILRGLVILRKKRA